MPKLKGEIWKEIKIKARNQKTRYGISNHGRVCSFKVTFEDMKLLKGTLVNGYSALKIKVNDTDYQYYVHKLVADYFLNTGSGKVFVIHKDHNKLNNKASNLIWSSKSEMEKHHQSNPRVKLYRERVKAKGHKLDAKKVKQIKRLIFSKNRKMLLKDIAEQFGISEMQLYRIKSGENWGHIKI